ncbi:CDP-alcohol phosphatidyltransferase family protein [Candidatus Uhrbacteria bacterium]|nr:CDP-alcohol phosphatidyltransferase family protein [Candidatus Uhrbacteria bacterium]
MENALSGLSFGGIKRRYRAATEALALLFPLWVTPNGLTWFRLFLAPLAYLSFHNGEYAAGTSCFLIGAGLDLFDGALARARNLVTAFGEFLDPLVDKVFVACILFSLVDQLPSTIFFFMTINIGEVAPVFVWINVGFAAALTALRLVKIAKGLNVAASEAGGLKMVLELLMLALLVAGGWSGGDWLLGGGFLLLMIMPIFAANSFLSQIQPLLDREPR